MARPPLVNSFGRNCSRGCIPRRHGQKEGGCLPSWEVLGPARGKKDPLAHPVLISHLIARTSKSRAESVAATTQAISMHHSRLTSSSANSSRSSRRNKAGWPSDIVVWNESSLSPLTTTSMLPILRKFISTR